MKLIAKQQKIDLTPFNREGEQTIKHTQINNIIFINQSQIGLVRIKSILVFDYSTLEFMMQMDIGQVTSVVYLKEYNIFCGYDSQLKNLVLFGYHQKPKLSVFYSFTEHKKEDREWNPTIFRFQSPYLVLIRQFYGQSTVIVFDINNKMEIVWQFTCCQTTLSKLDEISYLVNFRQFNGQRRILIDVYNINDKSNQTYKIEGVPQNIVKSIKMYQKNQLQKGKRNQQITVAIGVSYQALGCGLLIVKLFSEGNYEIIANIVNNDFEISKIIKSQKSGNIFCLSFRYNEQEQTTKLNLTNVSLDLNNNQLIFYDEIQVLSAYQHFYFHERDQLILTLSNNYQHDKQNYHISNVAQIGFFKIINKKSAYIHLCQQTYKDFSIDSLNQCFNYLD